MNIESFRTKLSKGIKRVLNSTKASPPSTAYWTEHNVTSHKRFQTARESLGYFHWRNDQYYNYIKLMPVTGFDDKIVLDFGCGPGNDVIGFSEYSKTKKLFGADVSRASIAEAKVRASLHESSAEFIELDEKTAKIPLPDESVDHIHSSGVLHHTPNPRAILEEFRRVLKPDGTIRVMVYHSDSLWVHLYVAYMKMVCDPTFDNLSLEDAFRKTTDGPGCPISRFYSPTEFTQLCYSAGLKTNFAGAAISMHEMNILSKRFDAIQDIRLAAESRRFLLELEFDEKGYPYYRGALAGIDGCYLGSKI